MAEPARQPAQTIDLSAAEVRAIAREATVYGFPMVDSYRVMHAYFVDRADPEYKGGWNRVHNTARVFTPDDDAIQTPNSDTPYSFVGADLRAEPLVFTVPEVPADRYISLQFIDLYTFNFAYVGTRATGNGAASYLLAGPRWRRETPKGIRQVLRCETDLALVLYRTQLFGPDDLEAVKRIQAGYSVQPLSVFLGERAPQGAAPIAFTPPLAAQDERTSPEFFRVLSFLLRFCPTHLSEAPLRSRFERLGLGAEAGFNPTVLTPAQRKGLETGMADGWNDFEKAETKLRRGEISPGDIFGTRSTLRNNYLYRMMAAADGIYGNSREEAIYPTYAVDADGAPLDGSQHRYVLRFGPGEMPPVHAFWSVTLYDLPGRRLVRNPIDRYLINSPMLPQLTKDDDGGVTLYLQKDRPDGAGRAANWLPAPDGPFFAVLRLYYPKPNAVEGRWRAPALERVD